MVKGGGIRLVNAEALLSGLIFYAC